MSASLPSLLSSYLHGCNVSYKHPLQTSDLKSNQSSSCGKPETLSTALFLDLPTFPNKAPPVRSEGVTKSINEVHVWMSIYLLYKKSGISSAACQWSQSSNGINISGGCCHPLNHIEYLSYRHQTFGRISRLPPQVLPCVNGISTTGTTMTTCNEQKFIVVGGYKPCQKIVNRPTILNIGGTKMLETS